MTHPNRMEEDRMDGMAMTAETTETTKEITPARQGSLDADGCAWVPETRYAELIDKVAKLNRRGAKIGCAPIGLVQVGERFIPVKDPYTNLVRYHRRLIRVQVTGEAPQLAGYTFVARVQHLGEAGNVVSRAPTGPEVTLPEDLWISDPVCEHCNTKRRRKDTFVLREDATTTLRQVGRNCLADYLRTADVEAALAFWKYLHEVERMVGETDPDEPGMGGGSGGTRYKGLSAVLHAAARAIRVDGWTSRTAARQRAEAQATKNGWETGYDGPRGWATSDTVNFILDPPFGRGAAAERENAEIRDQLAKYMPTPADAKVATDTMEWIRRRLDPASDYERNLKAALGVDYVDPKNLGLVVSAVQAWLRFCGAYEAKQQATRPDAGWMGEVGQRLRDVPCTVKLTRTWTNEERGYVTNLLVFQADDGHELKWFASGDRGFEVGNKVTVTGTVKAHEEWKGRKSTVLSRCAVQEQA